METRDPVMFEDPGVGQITSERLQADVRFLELYFVPHISLLQRRLRDPCSPYGTEVERHEALALRFQCLASVTFESCFQSIARSSQGRLIEPPELFDAARSKRGFRLFFQRPTCTHASRNLADISGGDLVRLVLEQAFESLPPLLAGLSRLALPLDRRLLVVRAPLHLLKETVLEHLLLQLFQGGLDRPWGW